MIKTNSNNDMKNLNQVETNNSSCQHWNDTIKVLINHSIQKNHPLKYREMERASTSHQSFSEDEKTPLIIPTKSNANNLYSTNYQSCSEVESMENKNNKKNFTRKYKHENYPHLTAAEEEALILESYGNEKCCYSNCTIL